ncbi:hypothetical protein IQ266_04890 [filamentous cyanobacterium LEGE 11480]|uniref:Uncharacterized protein n=1 Tax=Romeriopsis navalis LEGE 11480 TaxID=2777977 RepID=A0A928VK32_9CYAN|nr:hypothetical protein [Romeriopsis navalis]MBE9029097.1 hypothetical protein [Romeriopsis navalis LEGE 11480]
MVRVARQALALLFWMGLATYLYGSTLTLKPLWSDEFATIVFSLGRSFQAIPINQILDSSDLLAPLQTAPSTSWATVLHRLLTEDTHPPVFFWLNYEWIHVGSRWLPDWFAHASGAPSVWAVRSLSAFCGVLCVPAMFGLAWVTTRSSAVAQLAAGLMAVSPFGLYLAQEARHYSLATLWVILALTSWMTVVRSWQQRLFPSWWVSFAWIGINALGLATHYFFSLIFLAQAMVLLLLLGVDFSTRWQRWPAGAGWGFWSRVGLVAIATAINLLVWLAVWQSISRSELIQWVYTGAQTGWQAWLNPLLNLLVGGITMTVLLPIQSVPPGMGRLAGALTIVCALLIIWGVIRGLRQQWQARQQRLLLWATLASLAGALVGLLYLDYGLGADVTRGFRFNFLYLPSLLLLVAWGLGMDRREVRQRWRWGYAVLLLGLLGSLTVGHNWGYQKVHRPELIASAIVQLEQTIADETAPQTESSTAPILIAAPYRTHAQTTRLMSLAWDLQQRQQPARFYLDQQQCQPTDPIACRQLTAFAQQQIPAQMAYPFRLWLINYNSLDNLSPIGCDRDLQVGVQQVDGFTAQPYRCEKPPQT